MTAIEVTSIVGGAIGALAGLGSLFVQLRRYRPDIQHTNAETDKLRVETDKTRVEMINKLVDDVKAQRVDLDEARKREDECQQSLETTLEQLTTVIARVTNLESLMPSIVISSRLRKRSAGTMRVLNKIRGDGIVISSRDGLRFVWVSDTIGAALGRTPIEMIATEWRALVHPDDLERTEEIETNAWNDGGEWVNRFLHADGRWITMRWHFTIYDEEGFALSVVWFERRRDSAVTAKASA